MSTIDEIDKEIDQSKEGIKEDARGLWQNLKSFFFELFDLPDKFPRSPVT